MRPSSLASSSNAGPNRSDTVDNSLSSNRRGSKDWSHCHRRTHQRVKWLGRWIGIHPFRRSFQYRSPVSCGAAAEFQEAIAISLARTWSTWRTNVIDDDMYDNSKCDCTHQSIYQSFIDYNLCWSMWTTSRMSFGIGKTSWLIDTGRFVEVARFVV